MKPKNCFVSTVVIFLLLSCESYPQIISHNNFKLKESTSVLADSQKTQLTEKSPYAAAYLSFLLPGLGAGQLYNEQNSKFIRHIGISAGLIVFTILAFEFDWMNVGIDANKNTGIFFTVAGLYIGNWVWSVVDAVSSAKKINKQILLQKYRSESLDKFRFGFSLDKSNNLKLKFAIGL